MKLFVINLDRRPDRLRYFTERASELGLEFERVQAVDGESAELQARAEALPLGFTGRKLGSYVVACFESHRAAWSRIRDGDAPYGMVLEDDLVLHKDFPNYTTEGWIPTDADIVRLETTGTRLHLDRASVAEVSGRHVHRLRSTHLGAGAYIVSRSAATWLLENTEVFHDPVDQVLFNDTSPFFGRLATYQISPAPAVQGSLDRAPQEEVGDWATSTLTSARASSGASGRPRLSRSAVILKKTKGNIKGFIRNTRYLVVPYG